MTAIALKANRRRISCYYRPLILSFAALTLLCAFWFASRYPQLLTKAEHVGQPLASMAFSHEVLHVRPDAPVWQKIAYGAINWLDSMRIGMSFGVLLGALLHTVLRYYPLKIGNNLYLNSLKGALVGIPMGVCANCAVPTACGVTRGQGRIETALGFPFSSPNFNPVVVMMTFTAFPLSMSLTKYVLLLLVILVVVPGLISWLERNAPLKVFTSSDIETACTLPLSSMDCTDSFWKVMRELAADYAKHVWMLLKPTITIMLLASFAASAMLTLIPWEDLLSQVTAGRLAIVSLISVFMPVPIALDVMFAAQLHQQGIADAYVMLFLMTLGAYSIIPSIYLWREVSKPLAAILFAFFASVGWIAGLSF
jgi:uncharacterized membrane protein YraQ (UPF0718 family)